MGPGPGGRGTQALGGASSPPVGVTTSRQPSELNSEPQFTSGVPFPVSSIRLPLIIHFLLRTLTMLRLSPWPASLWGSARHPGLEWNGQGPRGSPGSSSPGQRDPKSPPSLGCTLRRPQGLGLSCNVVTDRPILCPPGAHSRASKMVGETSHRATRGPGASQQAQGKACGIWIKMKGPFAEGRAGQESGEVSSTRIRRTATHLFVISLKMLCWCLFCLTTLDAIGSFQLFPGSKESLKRRNKAVLARRRQDLRLRVVRKPVWAVI